MRISNMLVVGLLLVFCLGSSSYAFGMKPELGRPQSKKMMEKLAKELSLTKEQQISFIAQEKQIQEKDQQIRLENAKIMDKIQQEIKKDQPDMKVIKKYVEQISQDQGQIHLRRIENIIQFRQQLTIDQKKKFDELRPRSKQKHEKK